MERIFHEITPLAKEDSIYIVERVQEEFTFPIHVHDVFELNYLEGAQGAQRIVGDSIESVDKYELVLIANPQLAHAWKTAECTNRNIQETTIQFAPDLFPDTILNKNQFHSIRKLLEDARCGVAFDISVILRLSPLIKSLATQNNSAGHNIFAVPTLYTLIYQLSLDNNYQVLSSSSHTFQESVVSSNRIQKIDNYIRKNYTKRITVEDMANMINISPAAFSRFFKAHTGSTFVDYIADIRIGLVTRLLAESSKSVSEICYDCGFNNISNFNRIFKAKKGCSPKEFREIYKKNRILF